VPHASSTLSGLHSLVSITPGARRRGAAFAAPRSPDLAALRAFVPRCRSYAARATGSDSTAYAAEIRWNSAVASGPARSGCHCCAIRRHARRTAAIPASSSTPSRA
jgi:hypothetical protein